MIHARTDYDRIQDPAVSEPSLLSPGSSPIGVDEPVFLIRGKDNAAMAALYAWAKESRKNGVAENVCQHVELWACRIEDWQNTHGHKNADVQPEFLRDAR
jgi:hypothetical protein